MGFFTLKELQKSIVCKFCFSTEPPKTKKNFEKFSPKLLNRWLLINTGLTVQTVKHVYNGRPWDLKKWPFERGA